MSSFITDTGVSRGRVAELLRAARDLMGTGGKHWVKEAEKIELANGLAYCAAGAIRNVEGFTHEEREAAEVALAELIIKSDSMVASGPYTKPDRKDYEPNAYGDEDYESDLREWREGVIFGNNDAEETTFKKVSRWFTDAAARIKRS